MLTRFQSLPPRFQIMAEPNAADPPRRDFYPLLAKFLRHSNRPPVRLTKSHLDNSTLDSW
jgi:hypothetical protein